MARADYRGARGSNVGDDFHELWAVRQILALLEHGSSLRAVTLEGLRAEDEAGMPADLWDGVDCVSYYGGDTVPGYDQVVIQQLKYSGSDPQKPWTVAALTHTTSKTGNNSAIRRLADVFKGIVEKRKGTADGVTVRLVSNRPVDPRVLHVLSSTVAKPKSEGSSRDSEDVARFMVACGLDGHLLHGFVKALDLSSRTGSRFKLEENVLRIIASWTDDDSRTTLNNLLQWVGRKMLPEARGETLTRETILLWFGFSGWQALFPCPAEVKWIDNPVPRAVASEIVEEMVAGKQFVCVHGPAGCGKTTALQEIEAQLPEGSAMLVLDCYGAGRYLDSNASRHRPQEAFLELSNELATRLHVPLLLTKSKDLNYAKSFSDRVNRAAEVVSARGNDALLVVAIDAADNSIAAAQRASPPEHSFVNDFVSLGGLAKNVRLIVTARSGRVDQLRLPEGFIRFEVKGFSREETENHVLRTWSDAPSAWIDDFQHLSGGNPRVQSYALEASNPTQALGRLQPQGKDLEQLFNERLRETTLKCGNQDAIDNFAGALAVLPRPIPMEDLASISELTLAQVHDISADLAPMIRVLGESLGFADEDFEHFLGDRAKKCIHIFQARAADWFMNRRQEHAYAATNVASALLNAGRGKEIIDLLEKETEPKAIHDPLLRREVQLQRLRIAVQVSVEHKDTAEAVWTILLGAEALKTDAAIYDLVVSNPDLAAAFMRDSAERMILLDPQSLEHHGPLLFHIMLQEATAANAVMARDSWRRLNAWFRRRDEDRKEKEAQNPQYPHPAWGISDRDVAAEIEAMLLVADVGTAIDMLERWRPREFRLRVARMLVPKLIASGKIDSVEQCVKKKSIAGPWKLVLLVALALSGREVEVLHLENALVQALRRGLVRLDRLRDDGRDDISTYWLDLVLTGCEIAIARGGSRERLRPVLARLADKEFRRVERLSPYQPSSLDLLFRAHALAERLDRRASTVGSFLIDLKKEEGGAPGTRPPSEKDVDREKRERLQKICAAAIPVYDSRAAILVGRVTSNGASALVSGAVAKFVSNASSFSRDYGWSDIRKFVALAITDLLCISAVDANVICEQSFAVYGKQFEPPISDEIAVLSALALRSSLHRSILTRVANRVEKIAAMRTVASDKIDAILQLCRFLIPISREDAKALFRQAHQITEEIDLDALHQLRCLGKLALRATQGMNAQTRLEAASELYSIVTDAAVRLSEEEGFPWSGVSNALAALDVPFSLAALARWEDSGIVDRQSCLPSILLKGEDEGSLSAQAITALLPLLDFVDPPFVESIVHRLDGSIAGERHGVLEELARDELLRFGRGERTEVATTLTNGVNGEKNAGPWFGNLQRAVRFVGEHRNSSPRVPLFAQSQGPASETGSSHPVLLIPHGKYTSTKEIADTISSMRQEYQKKGASLSNRELLARMKDVVLVGDRVSHLEALSQLGEDDSSGHGVGEALVEAIREWASPAVNEWCKSQLCDVISRRLPELSRWLPHDPNAVIVQLLSLVPESSKLVPNLLIQGIARHVDTLNAPTVYELAALIINHLGAARASSVLSRYLRRLVEKIQPADLDQIEIADVPTTIPSALARFLFALLSDCDVRIRWRAAHAIRRLARLGETAPVHELLIMYDRKTEKTFRAGQAPFYWLAARLWLMIALDRVAHETPSALAGQGKRLLEVSTDDNLPHVLIRAFAKGAVSKLVDSAHLTLTPKQRQSLKQANTSPLARKKVRDPYLRAPQRRSARRNRRFDFDSIDTLPYWYEPLTRVFADVTLDEFTNTAEEWIVDRWGASNDVRLWKKEPRRNRYSERSWALWSHSHGGTPTVERFSTYLEWHAMWCAVGTLMKTKRLAKAEADDFSGFDNRLRRELLTCPPFWLADLRGPKPLEERFWFPSSSNDWVDSAEDEDFLREIGIGAGRTGMVVVNGWHETRELGLRLDVRVNSALVYPETAAALLRALQTTDEPIRYGFPREDEDRFDRLQIDEPPYRLLGWLPVLESSSGIDESDPFRNRVSEIHYVPGKNDRGQLRQIFTPDSETWWVTPYGTKAYVHEQWSDCGDTEGERHPERDGSHGARLWISVGILRKELEKRGLDLIVEIQMTRRKGDSDYQSFRQKETSGGRYDRVFVLRKDGTIEAAERRVGTWCASRP